MDRRFANDWLRDVIAKCRERAFRSRRPNDFLVAGTRLQAHCSADTGLPGYEADGVMYRPDAVEEGFEAGPLPRRPRHHRAGTAMGFLRLFRVSSICRVQLRKHRASRLLECGAV